MKFLDLITSADLRQHINGPTHHLGHTPDLLITRSDDKLISQVRTLPELLSDYNVVTCDINLPRPPVSSRSVSYRKTRDIDLQYFRSNIKESLPDNTCNNITDVDEQIVAYENTLRFLFDRHAPILTTTCNYTKTTYPLVPEQPEAGKKALQSISISIKRFVVNTRVP